jgi:nucleoid-associated protein YgaU
MESHPGSGAEQQAPFQLTLFASILLRRPFDELNPDDASIVRWAASEAARWRADGRAADLSEDVLAHRFVYRSLHQQAAGAPPIELAERGPRWERVLRAACMLRHRQRAVLAMYYCGALNPREVGAVVRASEAQTRTVIESAVAGVAKLVGEPVDVRRSLRMAAARLRAQREEPAEVEIAPRPARPRRVIENWITPATDDQWPEPLDAPTVPPSLALVKGSPVRTLIGDTTIVRLPEPAAVNRVILPARPRASRRGVFAAVAAMLVLAALTPGLGAQQPAPEPAPVIHLEQRVERALDVVAVTTDVHVLGKTVVRVERGDSLWALALEFLGDGARWRAIWNRNRGRMMSSGERFTRPDLILPGWRLVLPTKGARA